jgi:hypothetical protein
MVRVKRTEKEETLHTFNPSQVYLVLRSQVVDITATQDVVKFINSGTSQIGCDGNGKERERERGRENPEGEWEGNGKEMT